MTRFVISIALLLSLIALSACGDQSAPESAVAQPATVATFDELVKKANCLACHDEGNQMQLPTWRAVAARYKGKNNAEVLLMDKIAHGGSGAWGNMDMPPYHPELNEAERKALVQGILAADVAK